MPELDASACALDATTIDLCLSLFERAPFRSTKAAIKRHTLLDLRGAILAFIHISDGKLHDVNVFDSSRSSRVIGFLDSDLRVGHGSASSMNSS